MGAVALAIIFLVAGYLILTGGKAGGLDTGVIKWYGRTDEPIDPSSGWTESCQPYLAEAEEENPGLACELEKEECFSPEMCLATGAPLDSISMVGCCRCTIDCYRKSLGDESKYNILELLGIECWGCGGAINQLGEVDSEGQVKELDEAIILAQAPWGIAVTCLEEFESLTEQRLEAVGPLDFIEFYLLTDKEVDELKICLNNLEESGFCLTTADCCQSAIDEFSCDQVCLNEQCVFK